MRPDAESWRPNLPRTEVVGKTIFLINIDDRTGKAETVTQMIIRVGPDELILRDEDKNVFRMRRVGD
jgi:hypothetical protein